MRIVSGTHKGRRLQAPKKLPVRPTTDMAKEGLFNILSNRYHLPGLKVLDLFSGTGNISFEFASRGVTSITAVDSNYNCIGFISKTSNELDFDIATVKKDVFKFLEQTQSSFDIIFADPPYNFHRDQLKVLSDKVFENQLLQENGSFIIEHATQNDLSNLKYFKEKRKYGSSIFSFFGK